MSREQDNLLPLVRKLRRRIKIHRPALSQSEMQTRYALIDPLLRELDWDPENPTFVRPEFRGKDGRPDYALLIDGKPAVIGEAKRLKAENLEYARKQGFGYCKKEATRYLFATNGKQWEIYDTYRNVSTPIVWFNLEKHTAAEVCKKVKALQRKNVLRKHRQSISILRWNPPPKSRPIKIQFPDNSDVSVKTWRSLLVKVTRWLINGNHLKTSHCPILCKLKGRTHYAVSTEPFHLGGKPFGSSVKIRSFYVEVGGGSEYVSIACRTIIEHVGQNPAKFKVWLSSPRT